MFKASLSGQVCQTVLHKWRPLLPLFEAVMNAIQAGQEAKSDDHIIRIEVSRENDLGLDDDPKINGFKVIDSGVGFNDDNFGSFNTAFSEHNAKKGGKGLGRFLWLKAFDRVEIKSVSQNPTSKVF